MKKLMTSLLVSGLVLTGVSAGHHAEAKIWKLNANSSTNYSR